MDLKRGRHHRVARTCRPAIASSSRSRVHSDPSLLILDEATSSVETRTELLLQHAVASLQTDRTSFVIAHRLSTIRNADLILMRENGRIVETGTHDSLLASGGAYADLYAAQLSASVDEEDEAA